MQANGQKDELALVALEKRDKIYSAVPKNDLLSNLTRCMDRPGSVAVLGQTPGSRTFVGQVKGDNFWIRKKDASLHPFSRSLHGKVVSSPVGTMIEYNYKNNGFVVFLQITFITMVCGLNALVALILFFSPSIASASDTWIFISIPPALLVAMFALWKGMSTLSFGTDEEILDHVKMIAAGAHPSG